MGDKAMSKTENDVPQTADTANEMVPGHSDFNCPMCDAISSDYCQRKPCRWDVVDPKGSGVSRGRILP